MAFDARSPVVALVASASGGDMDSRGVGFRYTSNALDRCDDWNDGIDGRPVNDILSSGSVDTVAVANDFGWFCEACGTQAMDGRLR